MDRWDLHVGYWRITGWETRCEIPDAPKFPENGFRMEEVLIIVKAGGGVNLFWPDENHMPCCVHFSNLLDVPSSLVSFAGINVSCTVDDPDFDEPSKRLTVIMTACSEDNGSTGNTGTFVAQAIPPPPPCGETGR